MDTALHSNHISGKGQVALPFTAGELKPSPKGLTLQQHALPKLAQAVQAAMAFANRNDLLLEGGGK